MKKHVLFPAVPTATVFHLSFPTGKFFSVHSLLETYSAMNKIEILHPLQVIRLCTVRLFNPGLCRLLYHTPRTTMQRSGTITIQYRPLPFSDSQTRPHFLLAMRVVSFKLQHDSKTTVTLPWHCDTVTLLYCILIPNFSVMLYKLSPCWMRILIWYFMLIIWRAINSYEDYCILQDDIHCLNNWATQHEMKFHPDKW